MSDDEESRDTDYETTSEVSDIESADDINNCEPEKAIDWNLSKDKLINWSKTPINCDKGRKRAENVISNTPGITRYAKAKIDTIFSTFDLCFPHKIRSLIVEKTNENGKEKFCSSWTDLTDQEFLTYIGLLILAGVYKSNHESMTTLWHDVLGRPIFRATMSLQRFKNINTALTFDNKKTRKNRREADKFAPIRNVWDLWISQQKVLYNPGMNVTVDEQLLAFKGRCGFKQFMPSKPARYGIKFWVLCDSLTYYVWNMQPYLGKKEGSKPEKNQGRRVVLDLVENLKGRNVTCDNFFTDYVLLEELLKRHMTLVGTARANKTFLPPLVKSEQRKKPVFSSEFLYTQKGTLVRYVPKKYKFVTLLSSLHTTAEVANNEKKTPEIISFYNATKGAVDSVDQLISFSSVKRKTKKWPRVVFSNIIDISLLNAFVLWQQVNPNWNQTTNKRRIFLEKMALEIIQPTIDNRMRIPRGENALNAFNKLQSSSATTSPTPSTSKQKRKNVDFELPNQKKKQKSTARCVDCDKSKDRKAHNICNKCQKAVCGEHKIIVCKSCYNH